MVVGAQAQARVEEGLCAEVLEVKKMAERVLKEVADALDPELQGGA